MVSAQWTLVDWFGEVTGIKYTGNSIAEDVLIHINTTAAPLEIDEVASGEEISFSTDADTVSVSWRDSSGMHADVISLSI